ncbi:apoptosis-stimulating of p53 protein 1-like isoform X2 [Varroa destructor]|nr:apoptosis-stimulating of p53 protein 1-like isoform X2 [Varroa destructor]
MLRVELDRLAGLFRQKQTDLNALVQRVEVLAGQLDELERTSNYVQQLRDRLEKKRASNEGLDSGCQPDSQPLKYRNTLPPNSRINRPFTAVVNPQPRSRESESGTSLTNESNTLDTTSATSTAIIGLENLKNSSGTTSVISNDKASKKKTKDKSRRVSFDPLALLLDAALEGELDLVARIVSSTMNPHNDDKASVQPTPIIDRGNDEGITALHNAICASHLPVVLYLIEAGCDVNAQDADGWTPLHCAASCNNARVAKALVEAGACVYAMTHADKETPLDKCERQEPGFDECFELLMSAQNQLDGHVHAMFAYEKENDDELSYKQDDVLTILRRGDGKEREWYWCRAETTNEEGYVARNLLASYPRKPRRSDVDISTIETIASSKDSSELDDFTGSTTIGLSSNDISANNKENILLVVNNNIHSSGHIHHQQQEQHSANSSPNMDMDEDHEE